MEQNPRITFTAPPELVLALDRYAAAERRSRSNAINALIAQALAAEGIEITDQDQEGR